jgi:hypothetical protein
MTMPGERSPGFFYLSELGSSYRGGCPPTGAKQTSRHKTATSVFEPKQKSLVGCPKLAKGVGNIPTIDPEPVE